jgi:hypothetical protein
VHAHASMYGAAAIQEIGDWLCVERKGLATKTTFFVFGYLCVFHTITLRYGLHEPSALDNSTCGLGRITGVRRASAFRAVSYC